MTIQIFSNSSLSLCYLLREVEFDISSRDFPPEHWPITLTFVPGSPGNPGSPCGPMKPGSPFKNTIWEDYLFSSMQL